MDATARKSIVKQKEVTEAEITWRLGVSGLPRETLWPDRKEHDDGRRETDRPVV